MPSKLAQYQRKLRQREVNHHGSTLVVTGTDWHMPIIPSLPATRGKNGIPTTRDFARACGFMDPTGVAAKTLRF